MSFRENMKKGTRKTGTFNRKKKKEARERKN
jgi:hypothetical protein